MVAFSFIAVLGLAACGPSKPAGPKPMMIGQVSVDIPKLQQAFSPATPEAQISLGKIIMGVRYGQYPSALEELGKMANLPGITEPQKKVVNDVIEQLKQVIAKAPAAPGR